MAADAKVKVTVEPEELEDYLGPARFDYGELDAEDQVGMATGLVVSDAGGDIVQVEATRMDGKDDFILTGQLGDVMKESARAGHVLHPGPDEAAGHRPRHLREADAAHPRAGRRDSQGRPVAPA